MLVAYAWFAAIPRTTHGFVAYYTAARLLVTGDLGARVYEDYWFGEQAQRQSQSNVLEIFGPNPPSMAFAAAPLAFLPHRPARTLWILGSIAVLALASYVLVTRLAFSEPRTVFLLAVLLLSPSVFANILDGQIYLALVALFVGATVAMLSGRDLIAGILLGIALALKSSGAPLLLLLVALRRWRAAGAAVITFGALAGLVVIAAGPAIWLRYPAYVFEFLARPASSVTAYQTTRGFVRHFCSGCTPWIADTLIAGVIGLSMAWVWRRRARTELAIAAALTLSVVMLPIAEDTQFILLGIPLALWMSVENVGWAWLLPIGMLLIVPSGWTIHAFTTGWSALLAYPRLYAAWIIWLGIGVSLAGEDNRTGSARKSESPAARREMTM